MTRDQLEDALRALDIRPPWMVMPHDVYTVENEVTQVFALSDPTTEAEWNALPWNEPERTPYLAGQVNDGLADPNAPPKPAWAALQNAEPIALRNAALALLEREAKRRIIAAYGADDWEHEIRIRLRGDHTDDQDSERDRLRNVYRSEAARVDAMTGAQLAEYDAAADALWAPPDEEE